MAPNALVYAPMAPQKGAYSNGSSRDLPSDSPPTIHSRPVVIPPKSSSRTKSLDQLSTAAGPRTPQRRSQTLRRNPSSNACRENRPLPSSVASILQATSIPVPRRSRTTRGTRRLPRGKIHAEDFSRMMMDDVEEDHLMGGFRNSGLDILLSPPEENDNKSTAGSDYDMDSSSISGRSMSTESTPSLDHDLDSPSSPPSLLSQRSPLERRFRRVSLSEDCAFNHPLLDTEPADSDTKPVFADTISSQAPSLSSRPFPRLGSFKSNLTASLRAIKSAAQTVSAFTTSSIQPDDFLTQSPFAITPELTDDRRPPPMDEPPSPALRRYLNPIVVSPAEMHIYHEYPHGAKDASRNCPVSIQMQTYRRSASRSDRKRAFHLAGSGARDHRQHCPFDPEISPMSRQREPRENANFLRVVVLEMNMRRSGKLRDDIPPRARLWLPPRKSNQSRLTSNDYFYDHEEDYEDGNDVPSRWIGVTV